MTDFGVCEAGAYAGLHEALQPISRCCGGTQASMRATSAAAGAHRRLVCLSAVSRVVERVKDVGR